MKLQNRISAINLPQLRCAVVAADEGSFRRAAEVLLVRQSTLSRGIRQLEHLIGISIFDRSSGGVTATPSGRGFRISNLPIPLPFGALTAQRSVLSVQNFNSAVALALINSRARGETFIVSDPVPITVSDMITRYRTRLGKPPWLVPIPEKWLELSLKTIGLTSVWQRIGCPLIARPEKLLRFGWNPSPNYCNSPVLNQQQVSS